MLGLLLGSRLGAVNVSMEVYQTLDPKPRNPKPQNLETLNSQTLKP